MHSKFRILVTSLIVVGVWWATATYAQEPESFPSQQMYNGSVPYLSGGVGLDEREALSQMGKDYNLKLSFTETSGNYISDVAVKIRDSANRVALDAVSAGPWFFTKLPPGRYTVVVKYNENTQQKAVQVSGKGQSVLNFFWRP